MSYALQLWLHSQYFFGQVEYVWKPLRTISMSCPRWTSLSDLFAGSRDIRFQFRFDSKIIEHPPWHIGPIISSVIRTVHYRILFD
jgi:hypothetical protein